MWPQLIALVKAPVKLVVRLSAESERRIALLTVPVTRVEFEFEGFNEREMRDFMKRFDRAFQRAGG